MNAAEYQILTARTDLTHREYYFQAMFDMDGTEVASMHYALGITTEAGEVADLVKKAVFYNKTFNTEQLTLELGDVLWYISRMASLYGLDLGDIMEQNILKLRARFPDKFSGEQAIAQADMNNVRKEE